MQMRYPLGVCRTTDTSSVFEQTIRNRHMWFCAVTRAYSMPVGGKVLRR
jgi:hypothetical protein